MYLKEIEKIIDKEARKLVTRLGKDGRHAVDFEVSMEDTNENYVLCWRKGNLYFNVMLGDMILYDELDIQGKLLFAYFLNDFVAYFNDYLQEQTLKHTGCL